MTCENRDLTLDEALSDPVIGAVLRADRIDGRSFETLLRTAARRLRRRDDRASPAAVLAARTPRAAASGACTAW